MQLYNKTEETKIWYIMHEKIPKKVRIQQY